MDQIHNNIYFLCWKMFCRSKYWIMIRIFILQKIRLVIFLLLHQAAFFGLGILEKTWFNVWFMSFGAANFEIGVECQIFVIVIFFNCGSVLQFGAHSRYYKGALTQKRSFLVICTTFRSDFHVGWKNQNKH